VGLERNIADKPAFSWLAGVMSEINRLLTVNNGGWQKWLFWQNYPSGDGV